MTATTTRFGITYPVNGDPVANEPATIQTLANRLDLLLGEGGTASLTSAANTPGSVAVTFARNYTGSVGTGSHVFTGYVADLGTGPPVLHVWITGLSGTGFTLNWRCSAALSTFSVRWRFFPCLP